MALFSGAAGGAVGAAVVHLVADSSALNAGLRAAETNLRGTAARMDAIGRKTAAVGATLTRGVTVPLVAAGAVATKMALDFNQAFVRIQTLGGDTGQSMEALKAQVLDLAEATGQDPGGLANALYVVSSAGREAAQNAIPILTQAAKGAALGMGDVETITKVLTATTNSYGSEVLSAAQAMDILSQAVTDSSAEADELAASLGPVIGIAAQVGISFQEVAAAMATATVQGISTDRAATGLRFLMQSLAAPTQEATDKLNQYGYSAQALQRLIAREGLQGTLQTLADEFDLTSTRGQQAWSALVGGARGAIVANTLVGKHAAEAAEQVERLGDVAGVTQEKFEIFGQTITGKNAIALGQLKAAAIRLGTELIPVFQRLVDVVSGVVEAFNNLSPGAQKAVVAFGLVAAAAGPLLRIGGALVSLFARVGGAMGAGRVAAGAGVAAGGAAAGAGFVPAVLGGVAALTLFKIAVVDLRTPANALNKTVDNAASRFGQVVPIVERGSQAVREMRSRMEAMVRSLKFANTGLEHWVKEQVKAGRTTDEQARTLATAVRSLDRYGKGLNATEKAAVQNRLVLGDFAGALDIVRNKLEAVEKKWNIKIDADTGIAMQKLGDLERAIVSLPDGSVRVFVDTYGPGAQQLSSGGIVAAQRGLITRGPTILAGEGRYSTFAGRGAEAVIPLNSRGIAILAEAVRRGQGGGGGTHVHFHGPVISRDGHEFGRMVVDALTREQLRRS